MNGHDMSLYFVPGKVYYNDSTGSKFLILAEHPYPRFAGREVYYIILQPSVSGSFKFGTTHVWRYDPAVVMKFWQEVEMT